MNCEKTSELLPDYLGGELAPDLYNEVNKHLAECHSCNSEVLSLKDTISTLQLLTVSPNISMEKAPVPLSLSAKLKPLAYAAVLMLGICIGWFTKSDPAPVDQKVEISEIQLSYSDQNVHPSWFTPVNSDNTPDKNQSHMGSNLIAFSASLLKP